MRSYAVCDPQVSGEKITCHGYYLRQSEALHQAALHHPTVIIKANLRAWLRWQWRVFRGQV